MVFFRNYKSRHGSRRAHHALQHRPPKIGLEMLETRAMFAVSVVDPQITMATVESSTSYTSTLALLNTAGIKLQNANTNGSYSFTNEEILTANWNVAGKWRLESTGIRMLDGSGILTSKQLFDSNVQSITFSYTITNNTQAWVSLWGETFVFDLPANGGAVTATITRSGDAVTFSNGISSPTTVILKQANAGVSTPLVIQMDQRNLWRPSMELLLQRIDVTGTVQSATSPPSAPAVVRGAPRDGAVGLVWSRPFAAGSAIKDYLVQYSSNSGTTWVPFPDGTSTATSTLVTGLTNGLSYAFRVSAVNAGGAGAWSAPVTMVPQSSPLSYSFTNEEILTANWNVAGKWRLESTGIRMLDGSGILTSKQLFDSNVQSITFSYTITNNTQAWVSLWGETFVFDLPANGGAVTATITRSGDAVTFSNGISSPTTVILKQANAGVSTPLVIQMDQRNLWRPSMELLLQRIDVTGTAIASTPTNVVGTPGNTQVSLTWTAPSSNGGSAITDYVIQYSSNSGAVWTTFNDGVSTATTATITGLVNGTSYVFRVASSNSAGQGQFSTNSSPATPITAPSMPLNVVGAPGNTQMSLTWTAPSTNGGSAIRDYVIEYRPYSGSLWKVFTDPVSTARSAVVTGLRNGVPYFFRVAAINAAGVGAYSSVNATPRTIPGAPGLVQGKSGDSVVSLTWYASWDNGGSSITDYIIQYRETASRSWMTFRDSVSRATSATVTGLKNGFSYEFRVIAKNAAGLSRPSLVSKPVVPSVAAMKSLSLKPLKPGSSGISVAR